MTVQISDHAWEKILVSIETLKVEQKSMMYENEKVCIELKKAKEKMNCMESKRSSKEAKNKLSVEAANIMPLEAPENTDRIWENPSHIEDLSHGKGPQKLGQYSKAVLGAGQRYRY